MTSDVRGVNAQTERLVWPMPKLEAVLNNVSGSRNFFYLRFLQKLLAVRNGHELPGKIRGILGAFANESVNVWDK